MNSTEHHGSTIKKRIIRPSEQPVASPVETTKNSAPIKSIKKVIRVQDKYWTNISGAYRIDPESLHNYLWKRGYRTYKPEGVRTTVLVNVDNNRVREISTQEIWELCWKYIDSEYEFSSVDERRQVKDVFHRSRSLFHKQNLTLLKTITLKECKDTKDMSYMFFNDCVMESTADKILIKNYSDIEGFVFDTDISHFDFKPLLSQDQKSIDNIIPEGEFYEFIQDLCRNDNQTVCQKSLESMVTIIGYLVHRHKDPANAKAIIFMDTFKDGNPNGATGKSLLTKGIGRVRESAFQDGKFFASSDKFAFSHVNYGTRILIIDDVPKNFDFEKIFPLITEKAVIERKYENKYVIPFEDSPKIVITTNYTVEGVGNSHKRRKVEFILSETFSPDYTPEDKYGHLLFVEWDDINWWEFYNFIIYCLQQFLKKGIVMPMFNVAERKLKMEATPEFILYISNNGPFGEKLNKRTLYDDFYVQYPNHYRIEMNTFRNWLKFFADAYGFKFIESHSGNDNYCEFSC